MMTLTTFKAVLMAMLLVVMAGCAAIRVTTDYDASRDYAALKTYAWLEPSKKLIVDPLVDNDLMNSRVRRSVESEMTVLGYVKARGDKGADFLISYHVSAEDKLSVSSFHSHFGYYPCWHGCFGYGQGLGHGSDISVRQYKQGTFMLDVVDLASNELMWRGVASKQLNSGSPEERDDYVREIVAAILAKFPPTIFHQQ
ncbi:MAG: DUF4136 domain-containing protein [Pseudomonadales bacterium]